MKVAKNILELVGNTPIIQLSKMTTPEEADIFVKLENFNPGGSVKDRPGIFMLNKAEEEGVLKKGSIILEATSGNTGISLAMAASVMGYPVEIVMPENMSEERKKLLTLYGAKLILTPAAKGMVGAVEAAEQMAKDDDRYFLVRQFENKYNVLSHENSTGPEILEQMEHNLDAFVCGVGSAGTITGTAKILKKALPDILVVAVEPASSAVLSGKPAGSHNIPGIGAGFVPKIFNREYIDRVITIKDKAAIIACKELAQKEALLLGISSGAAVCAAKNLAKELGPGKRILAIAPDGVEKYMSIDIGGYPVEE